MRLLEEQAGRNRIKYLQRIEREHPGVSAGNAAAILSGEEVLLDVPLRVQELAADCDVLTKVHRAPSLGSHSYEPISIVGTHQVTKEQKLALLFWRRIRNPASRSGSSGTTRRASGYLLRGSQ